MKKKTFSATQLKEILASDLIISKKNTTGQDLYQATALSVKRHIAEAWLKTIEAQKKFPKKQISYLSLEFLLGRALGNNVLNLGLEGVDDVLAEYGEDLKSIEDLESDAGLGNGGLGRLAACFLDSMASLDMHAFGYGIRYEFGIFRQSIHNGWQQENPDEWLKFGNVWEVERPHVTFPVQFGGRVEMHNHPGRVSYNWVDTEVILGRAYDMPIVGYGAKTINTLRLWKSMPSEEFDLQNFNQGDYLDAVRKKFEAENISKVLYPNDTLYLGKELRLRQQYFFVSCSLQDIIHRLKAAGKSIYDLPSFMAIQLNDTHPSISVAELMRLLIDEEGIGWDEAWDITVATLGYTNHTLMPEALEKWPVSMFERLLPRHLQIIFEINRRFMIKAAAVFGDNLDAIRKVSIIEEGAEKQIRMANLAIIGSHSTNGVAALHSDLLKSHLVPELAQIFPERFNNKTNGITQRRWLLLSNPKLAALISSKIGKKWITDFSELKKLAPLATDESFQKAILEVKRENKRRFIDYAYEAFGWQLREDAIFDVQIKRIHEYKRQLLNVLQIVMLYQRMREEGAENFAPRVFIIGGKAAPGYRRAKLIIKLINNVASVINNDPRLDGKLQLHFLPNYRVSLAEKIIPAADLSEQISTAGTEASGTGNMKFMCNGALTLGTLDGANIEIVEEAGDENAFIFGLKTPEVQAWTDYRPHEIYASNERIKKAIDFLFSETFSLDHPGLFDEIRNTLLSDGEQYYHLADLASYHDMQMHIEAVYKDQAKWAEMVIKNIAAAGKFSSDRTIKEYAEVWGLQ